MIKVLTDQSASDREPAIILKESNPPFKASAQPEHERKCHPLAVGKAAGGAQKKRNKENEKKEK